MTDPNGPGPDLSATAAPGELHERSVFLEAATGAAAIVAGNSVYDLGKAAAGAVVDKIRAPKHDDGPPPPSGQLDTPAD